MRLDPPRQLLDAFRHGGMVVLVDEDDERIGGVIMAPAATVSAEQVNFMARNARGLRAQRSRGRGRLRRRKAGLRLRRAARGHKNAALEGRLSLL